MAIAYAEQIDQVRETTNEVMERVKDLSENEDGNVEELRQALFDAESYLTVVTGHLEQTLHSVHLMIGIAERIEEDERRS